MVAGARPATLEPQPDFPTNRGGLCAKGWTANSLLDHPDRLLTPLVRTVPGDRRSPLRAASWDEALDTIADGITDLQRRYGPDAVGCFGGGGLTNEKAYQLGKFARVALRTSAIDYNGRFCMSSSATAGNRAFGIDRGLPFPLSDIAETKALLLVGGNPAETMPPAMQFFDAGRAAGAVHIVVDPRRTATAAGAAIHLAPDRAPTWPWPTGCCRSRSARISSTGPTSTRGPRGSRRSGPRWPRSGPTGSSGSPGFRWRCSSRWCARWRERRRR